MKLLNTPTAQTICFAFFPPHKACPSVKRSATALGLPSNAKANPAAAPAAAGVYFTPPAVSCSVAGITLKPLAYMLPPRSVRHANQPHASHVRVSRPNPHLFSLASLLSPALQLYQAGCFALGMFSAWIISQYSMFIGNCARPQRLHISHCDIVMLGLQMIIRQLEKLLQTLYFKIPLVLPKSFFYLCISILYIMARIKTSAIVADIRGTLGGNVFSSNKGGNYVRRYKKPTNPNSIAQQIVRLAFMSLSSFWRNLSDSQRLAWNTIAPHYPYMDSLGESKILSGQQLFMKLNQQINGSNVNNVYSQSNLVYDPSEPQTFPTITNPNTSADISTALISLSTILIDDSPLVPTGFVATFDCTQMLSAGITAPQKGLFKNLLTVPEGTDLTDSQFGSDLFSQFTATFGLPLAGSSFYMNMSLISTISGEKSVPARCRVAVSA